MSSCLVTCGPASTRIDAVRRITNFSTGELGIMLSQALLEAGHRVICLRGEGAGFPVPVGLQAEKFFSNNELLNRLKEIARSESIDTIFHAAALTDFEVSSVTDLQGNVLAEEKISSAVDGLVLRLSPATKVIGQLRVLFPQAEIIGWKYELSGTRETAFCKARQQIIDNQTDACVLNGDAYGKGFAWISPNRQHALPDKAALVHFLLQRLHQHS